MIKVYCDKCGKELQDYDTFTINIQVPEIHSFEDFYKTGDRVGDKGIERKAKKL